MLEKVFTSFHKKLSFEQIQMVRTSKIFINNLLDY